MVLAFQTAYQLSKMSAQIYIANLVSLSILRELGPVLTALVIAGRIGAAIAAQIGTMKVTEQIDALQSLAASPIKYLVTPRLIALCCMLPLLTVYADLVGIIGGYIVSVYELNISSQMYIRLTFSALVLKDFFTGLLKAFLFGIIIAVISCYEGLHATGGAEGVGKATTDAVVRSFILIVAVDCLVTAIFFYIL
jgi:phospholipid/cholesterol/gamma-HCH transport system permease protein